MTDYTEKLMLKELNLINVMTSKNQQGQYRISEDQLLCMPLDDFKKINWFITKLSIAYPEYVWEINEDPDRIFRGVIISWYPNIS